MASVIDRRAFIVVMAGSPLAAESVLLAASRLL